MRKSQQINPAAIHSISFDGCLSALPKNLFRSPMTPKIREIAKPVLNALDRPVRQGVLRRIEAMERELAFLVTKEDGRVFALSLKGWGEERLQLLFVLNSVYQHVLGPLQGASRGGPAGLGKSVAIRHGSESFSSHTSVATLRALNDFNQMVRSLGFARDLLHLNTCEDIVFRLHVDSDMGFPQFPGHIG